MGHGSSAPPKTFSDQELERLRTEVARWMERGKRTTRATRPPRRPAARASAATPVRGADRLAPAAKFSLAPVRPPPAGHPARQWTPRLPNRWLIPVVAAMVVAGSCISLWSAIYLAGWDNRLIRGLAATVPLPAAYAGGRTLRLADFFSAADRLQSQWPTLTTSSARTAVIASFARQVALERLAAELRLAVHQPGAADQSPSDRLERAVVRALAEQPAAWERSRQRADKLQRAITAGQISFSQAALTYSRHPSAAAGGDLGYRGRAELAPEIFSLLIQAPSGTVHGPLRGPDGWWLAQAPEFIGATATPEFLVHLKVIVIPPDGQLRELLAQKIAALNVKRLVP